MLLVYFGGIQNLLNGKDHIEPPSVILIKLLHFKLFESVSLENLLFEYLNKADKRLSFCHIHSTTHLLPKSEISTLQLYVIVVPLVLDLVGNPIDRFCHDTAHLILQRFQVNKIIL